ncbi:MAG TPA: hypothetical protein VE870_04555, partial [Bacteroidales bacterium]|nr:hypothetical protein [Bacteroidales bacterium]
MIISYERRFTKSIFCLLHFLFLISFLPQGSLYGQAETKDSLDVMLDNLKPAELTRGERLFYGLVYNDDKSVNCAGCHNTVFVDTFNWNPSAEDIALKYKDRPVKDLVRVLLKPRGKKLSETHNSIDLTPEDIVMIKGFMDDFSKEGITAPKPVFNTLILFVIAVLLFLGAITDLIITKKIQRKWIHLIVIVGSGFFITKTLVVEAIQIGRSQYYQPSQPVKFSHAVHAGQN